jgi:hypothetical protein
MRAVPPYIGRLLVFAALVSAWAPSAGYGAAGSSAENAALERIHKVFREKGIEFSNPTVFVQARHAGGTPEEETAPLVSMAGAATGQAPKSERR